VTSERNKKKQTQTLGQQKKGELEKARGRKKKKQKPTQVGQGLRLGFIQMDGLKTGKLGGALGGAGSFFLSFFLDHSCPSSGFDLFTFSHSEETLNFFLSFFLQNLLKFSLYHHNL
jgi:hypothetical protein